MTRRRCAGILLAGGIGVVAVAGASGLASAQPEPTPPVPSLIDQLVTLTPALSVNPTDDGSKTSELGDFGMICQNLWSRCR